MTLTATKDRAQVLFVDQDGVASLHASCTLSLASLGACRAARQCCCQDMFTPLNQDCLVQDVKNDFAQKLHSLNGACTATHACIHASKAALYCRPLLVLSARPRRRHTLLWLPLKRLLPGTR